jgi:DNA-binding XRE family transcriptional regulator
VELFDRLARVSDRWNIALTAGRETMGRHRVSGSRDEAGRTNPQAAQAEIARAAGVSRPTVGNIEGGRWYRKRPVLSVG